MTSEKIISKAIVKYLNTLHLWFTEHKGVIANDLGMSSKNLDYTNSFFKKILRSKGVKPQGTRTLSNLFKGKGSLTWYSLTLLKNLVEILDIDVNEGPKDFEFKRYAEIKPEGLKLSNNSFSTFPDRLNFGKKTSVSIELIHGELAIYDTVGRLILEKSEHSIQGVTNGGLMGKAPNGWFEKILNYIKLKHNTSNPVTFEIVTICKKEDFENELEVWKIKNFLTTLRKENLQERIKRYVSIQNNTWLGPDFVLIDRKYLIFNWPLTLDKTQGADRTQVGFLISDSFEAIQYYKDFFEKIILDKERCVLLEDYLDKLAV